MTDPAHLVAQQKNLECTLPKGALLKPKGAAQAPTQRSCSSSNPRELPKLTLEGPALAKVALPKPKGAARAQPKGATQTQNQKSYPSSNLKKLPNLKLKRKCPAQEVCIIKKISHIIS